MPPEPSDAVRRAHDRALECGEESYQDPVTGYTVLASITLAARGECCGSGCRHCPYPPDEQRRVSRSGAGGSSGGTSRFRSPDQSTG